MSIFFWLLLLGMAWLVLFTFLSGVLFWYEALNDQSGVIKLPRQSHAFFWRVLCARAGAFLLNFLLRNAGLWARVGKKSIAEQTDADAMAIQAWSRADKRPPLILTHGLYDNAAVWLYLARRLRRAGYVVFTFSYPSVRSGSLAEALSGLHEHIQSVGRLCGRPPVLVGHSLGGIISCAWLNRAADPFAIRGVITLGAPFGGSKLATLACGPLAPHLRPDSALIAEIAAWSCPTDIPLVAIASPIDEAVLPPHNLLPPRAAVHAKFLIAPPVSHFGMLFHRKVGAMLLEELRLME